MTNKRFSEIDYAKGIGAFLVIIGHLNICPTNVRTTIYYFHMPLFLSLLASLYIRKLRKCSLMIFQNL